MQLVVIRVWLTSKPNKHIFSFMKYNLAIKPLSEINTDVFVFPIFKKRSPSFRLKIIDLFLQKNPDFGEATELKLLYTENQLFVLVGLGDESACTYGTIQDSVGTAIKEVSLSASSVTLVCPKVDGLSPEKIIEAIIVGSEVANYNPGEFKSDKKQLKLNSLEILVEKAERSFNESLKTGQIIAEAVNLARRLGDTPPNILTPKAFLEEAKKIAKINKLKISVIDEKIATKKGMGAFIGVAKGSDEPSYIIALEYIGDFRSKEKLGLCGKGITFDTGGVSVKPAEHMEEMKYDMAGAATVLAVIQAIAKLKLKLNLAVVMAVSENHLGSRSQRPGDIVKSYNGKTIEIVNTDAEGRLVLADSMTYAQRDLKVTKLIDLATLTGAVVVALGTQVTGLMSNDKDFTMQFIEAGELIGEKYWQLPMDKIFDDLIKSDFADLANSEKGGSPRPAGATYGGKFLEQFIEEGRPWIHLDIAGTAYDMAKKSFREVGATGVGVKTLIKFLLGN